MADLDAFFESRIRGLATSKIKSPGLKGFKPFRFEAKTRMNNAMSGIEKLRDSVDTLIVIPNDKILEIVDKRTSMPEESPSS